MLKWLIIKYKPSIDKSARIKDKCMTARNGGADRRGTVSVRCEGMTSCMTLQTITCCFAHINPTTVINIQARHSSNLRHNSPRQQTTAAGCSSGRSCGNSSTSCIDNNSCGCQHTQQPHQQRQPELQSSTNSLAIFGIT